MTRILPDYAVEYLEYLSEIGRGKATLKQYSSDLDKFFVWLESYKKDITLESVASLTSEEYQKYITYLERKKLSDATLRRLVSVLKRFLLYLNISIGLVLKTASKERPLRQLGEKDFITDYEYKNLLKSILTDSNSSEKAARDFLLDRNFVIVTLSRHYGLTPAEISNISMNQINTAQGSLQIEGVNGIRKYQLHKDHVQHVIKYLNTIRDSIRPRKHSNDPLFVAFHNTSMDFIWDYELGTPKRLSVRGIQEMIKDEVRRAGLRKLSATNFRNTCILDYLMGYSEPDTIKYFGLTDTYSLHRYKSYLKSINKFNLN